MRPDRSAIRDQPAYWKTNREGKWSAELTEVSEERQVVDATSPFPLMPDRSMQYSL